MLGMNLPEGPLRVWDVTGGWPILIASEQDAIRELGPEKGRLNPIVRMMARSGYTRIYRLLGGCPIQVVTRNSHPVQPA